MRQMTEKDTCRYTEHMFYCTLPMTDTPITHHPFFLLFQKQKSKTNLETANSEERLIDFLFFVVFLHERGREQSSFF